MQTLYKRLMQDKANESRLGGSALNNTLGDSNSSHTAVDFTDVSLDDLDDIASLTFGLDQIDNDISDADLESGNIFSPDFDLGTDDALTADVLPVVNHDTHAEPPAEQHHHHDHPDAIDTHESVNSSGTGTGGTSNAALPTFTFDQIADQLTNGYWEDYRGVSARSFNLDASREIAVDISGLTADGQFLATNALQAWSDVTGITFTFLQGTGGGSTLSENIDAAANITTTASFAPGQTFAGSLSSVGDNDWVRISLQAGQTYTFGLDGDGTTSQLGDPLLSLRNASGTQIASNDDGGAGLNSLLTYTAATSGTYYVSAGSYNNSQSGNYLLTAQNGTSASADIVFDDTGSGAYSSSVTSGGQILSSSVNVSTAWLNSYGTSLTSFNYQTYIHEIGHALGLGHGGNYNGSASYATDAHYANDSMQATIMSYFNQSQNTAITASNATVVSPQIADILAIQNLYGNAPATRAGNTTYGVGETSDANVNILGTTAASIYDGGGIDTFNFSSNGSNQRIDLTPETYSDTNGRIGNLGIARGTIIENVTTGSGNDTITGNGANNILYSGNGADTLYGGAGNDTLSGGAGSDRLNGGAGNDLIFVDSSGDVVDGGSGIDRVRVVNTAGLSIDIGSWVGVERIDGDTGNDVINATGNTAGLIMFGRNGNDNLTGGAASDFLFGEAGTDTLFGGAGNDVVDGGSGADSLSGGAGNDVFFIDDAGDVASGGSGLDRARIANGVVGIDIDISSWTSIERFNASVGNDTINGSGSLEDLIINGNIGNDLVMGGSGSDLLFGGSGSDSLTGGGGQDFLFGGTGADTFSGGAGDDFFYIDNAGDIVTDGGAGIDRVVISNAGLSVTIDNSWANVERIDGASGAETIDARGQNTAISIIANAGNDILLGGTANDVLFGNAGADTLTGGVGNDQLFGGGTDGGADIFIFSDGFGIDVIRDWEDGFDFLDFSTHSGVNGLGDLMVDQSSGANTVITFEADSITLRGFAGAITIDDFIF